MQSRYLFPSTVKSSSQSHSSISECIWVSYTSCLEPNRVHMFLFEGHAEIERILLKDMTWHSGMPCYFLLRCHFLHPIHGTFGASWGPKRWEVPDVTASMLNKQVVLWNLVCLGGFRPKKKWCILDSFVCSLWFCLHRRQGNMQRQAWRSNALRLKDVVASSKILYWDQTSESKYL